MGRKKLFCCAASRDQYTDYYMRQQQQQQQPYQTGGELPAFVGATRQRGHGNGSILSGLFRRVLPFLRANARNFGANAIKAGLHVADDVMQGRKFTDSVKRRVPEGIKTAAQNIAWQTGDGLRVGRRQQSSSSSSSRKRKRSRSIGCVPRKRRRRRRQQTTKKRKGTRSGKKKTRSKKSTSSSSSSRSDIFG